MLKHNDIWRAIDALAEKRGLSASGLAKLAGLDSTAFNPSKRTLGKRKRWPSTESIARILQVTETSLGEFTAMAENLAPLRQTLPLLGYGEAGREGYFDDAGYPTGEGWDEIALPFSRDPHGFALEISGKSMEPVYRAGDYVIVSPSEQIRRGDRVALRTLSGEVMVKQLGHNTASRVELISLNPAFAKVSMLRSALSWIYRITWASQ